MFYIGTLCFGGNKIKNRAPFGSLPTPNPWCNAHTSNIGVERGALGGRIGSAKSWKSRSSTGLSSCPLHRKTLLTPTPHAEDHTERKAGISCNGTSLTKHLDVGHGEGERGVACKGERLAPSLDTPAPPLPMLAPAWAMPLHSHASGWGTTLWLSEPGEWWDGSVQIDRTIVFEPEAGRLWTGSNRLNETEKAAKWSCQKRRKLPYAVSDYQSV